MAQFSDFSGIGAPDFAPSKPFTGLEKSSRTPAHAVGGNSSNHSSDNALITNNSNNSSNHSSDNSSNTSNERIWQRVLRLCWTLKGCAPAADPSRHAITYKLLRFPDVVVPVSGDVLSE